METDFVCLDCKEECTIERPSFSYSGTHCTNGMSGIHTESYYVSKCCGGEYQEKEYVECDCCDGEEYNHLGRFYKDEYTCSKCLEKENE